MAPLRHSAAGTGKRFSGRPRIHESITRRSGPLPRKTDEANADSSIKTRVGCGRKGGAAAGANFTRSIMMIAVTRDRNCVGEASEVCQIGDAASVAMSVVVADAVRIQLTFRARCCPHWFVSSKQGHQVAF